MGRKPIGERAMTPAERQRRRRERIGKPDASSDKAVTNEPQAAEWDADRARLQARIAALQTEVERLKDINALKSTLPQGLRGDNQGETAASIRMRMRRGWTAVVRA